MNDAEIAATLLSKMGWKLHPHNEWRHPTDGSLRWWLEPGTVVDFEISWTFAGQVIQWMEGQGIALNISGEINGLRTIEIGDSFRNMNLGETLTPRVICEVVLKAAIG